MIAQAVTFLTALLDAHIDMRTQAKGPHVVCGSPVGHDAQSAAAVKEKLVLTLMHMQRETVSGHAAPHLRKTQRGFAQSLPPLHLNLSLLISANFPEDYERGLRLLSSAIGFFQVHPVFHARNAPDLPEGFERLTVEWQDISFNDAQTMWSTLGGVHMPAALYRIRMIVIEDTDPGTDVPVIKGTSITGETL